MLLFLKNLALILNQEVSPAEKPSILEGFEISNSIDGRYTAWGRPGPLSMESSTPVKSAKSSEASSAFQKP